MMRRFHIYSDFLKQLCDYLFQIGNVNDALNLIYEYFKKINTHEGTGLCNTRMRKILNKMLQNDALYASLDAGLDTIGFRDGVYSFKHNKLLSLGVPLNPEWDKYFHKCSDDEWDKVAPV